MMDLRGKRALVVGLARSGRAAAKILSSKGARVTVTDSRPPSTFPDEITELTRQKIGAELGLHREQTFINQDLIVLSPGVPFDLPYLEAARRHKVPIVPEIEVASWFLKGSLMGVTGSNGKTTTTTLLGKMLESSGLPTFVGGNIGVPLISAVEKDRSDSLLVTELSSFQLEAIQTFRPHVAVLLNLSPNHLDRHRTFEAYVGAKARIFHNQTAEDYAILNADDPYVMDLAPAIASQKIFFSRTQNLPDGVFVSHGHIIYRVRNLERILLETSDVRLRGDFNVDDVLAASAAACVVGAGFDAVRNSVREFNGVEHRLEFIREIHRVEFYNDSKATSVDATAKALTAFDKGVHLILGGKDKGAPYTPLRPLVKDRVSEVLVIGAAADKIAADLDGAVEIVRAGNLETAVRRAYNLALPGDTVLLAPACASFDQFQDYEHRGRVFKELVARLADEVFLADSPTQAKKASPRTAPPASVPPASAGESANKAAASTEEEAGQPEGDAPSPYAIRAPGPKPDLVYLYEKDAEEYPPLEDDAPAASPEEGPQDIEADDLTVPESISDEALPFEVATSESTPETAVISHPMHENSAPGKQGEQPSLFAGTQGPDKAPGA